jgi:hypothetical protein
MNGPRLEAFLAKIYVDREARARFFNDQRGEAFKAGLAEEEIRALEDIDRIGLSLMAASLERKGSARSNKAKTGGQLLIRHMIRKKTGALWRMIIACAGRAA